MQKRKIRYEFHASSLLNYLKSNHIPRSLRLQKASTLFTNNIEFKQKLISILNKCSFDLMLILVQRSKAEVVTTQNETAKMKDQINSSFESAIINKQIETMQSQLKKYSDSILSWKTCKFSLDIQYYETDQVYPWFKKVSPSLQSQLHIDNRTISQSSLSSQSDREESQVSLRPLPHRVQLLTEGIFRRADS